MGSIRRTKVIELAKKYADEGYHEEGNNWTIFGQMLDQVGYFEPQQKNGQPWCMTFVDALFFMASDSDDDEAKKYDAQNYLGRQPSYGNLSAGCTYAADYFRAIGQYYDVDLAYIGDVIYFGKRGHEEHVGIIIGLDYDDDGDVETIYTVEGNKRDAVRYCQYNVSDKYIAGVGKATFFDYYDDLDVKPEPEPDPEPTPEPEPTEAVTVTLEVLERGSTGGQVNTVKALLNEFGFADGMPLDGDFDWDTEMAVRAYQTAHGLDVTGIVDAEVWNLLLK